ncbi:MAG TPA: hypothetical protein VGJ02_01340 [Pyrinomonadaceae bacterium]
MLTKNNLSLALAFFAFIGMTAVGSSAQTPKRIEFARGKSSATVSGSTGSYGVSYVLRARSGQKVIVDLDPASNVGIRIETEGADGQQVLLREERGGHYEIGLEEGGDYTIFIGSTKGRPVSFKLTIKITKLAEI